MADDESDKLIRRSKSEERTEKGTKSREANQHDYQTAEVKAKQVANSFEYFILNNHFRLFIMSIHCGN